MTKNSYSRRQFLGKSTLSGLGIGLASALAPGLSNASETRLFKKSTTKFNNEDAEFRGANISIGEIMTREGCDEAIAKAEKVGLNAVFLQLCASVLAQPKWIETACQDWPRWVN
ncbi:MAG: twin-arginine translocation signal domain-containing protein, partial [Bacteroidales bacterium]|nr:twin-arginine translocation signal domain-containing protein [Bacteroidales bacterium]